jgi:ParB family chromosome partitioning protein
VKQRRDAIASSISALLGSPVAPKKEPTPSLVPAPAAADAPPPDEAVLRIPVDSIVPNPRQPRTTFDGDSLSDLANSIRRHGVLQPLIVRIGEVAGKYTLLAGERRLRASQIAGLDEVPAILLEANEEQMLELSIVENVQRDDLNPIEEARGYKALMNSFGWTQEEIADRVGKKRPTIANFLRLLTLPDNALLDLQERRMTAGHARAILSMTLPAQREELRRAIVGEGLSVREAERRATEILTARPKKGPLKELPIKNRADHLDIDHLRERLIEQLGCPVRMRPRTNTSGTIEITYQNLDDLDRVLEILGLERD